MAKKPRKLSKFDHIEQELRMRDSEKAVKEEVDNETVEDMFEKDNDAFEMREFKKTDKEPKRLRFESKKDGFIVEGIETPEELLKFMMEREKNLRSLDKKDLKDFPTIDLF